MDTELVAYLDRRFDGLRDDLSETIRTGDEETRRVLRDEIRTGDEETRRVLRDEIRAGDEETRHVLRDEIRVGDEETRRVLRDEIRVGDEETRRVLREETRTGDEESRRHMGVLTESLLSKIELVGEGVLALSERVDRLETNIRGEFTNIDRRLLHLTAQLSDRRRRR